ncbi:MAG: hypothetical protein AAF456_22495 [Planctomycetota bacterium]
MSAYRLTIALLALLVLSGCKETPQQAANVPAGATADAMPDLLDGEADSQQHPLNEFEERNDDPLAAAADRYQRRLSADGTIPQRALLNACDQRKAMVAIESVDAAGLPMQWDWVGPGNIGGRLRPIVIHPTNTDIIYVGSASGGIWKSIDGASSWQPLDDFLPSLSIGDMVMHPEDPDTLYAATGEGFFDTVEGTSNTAAVRGAGIFKTTDAGATWNQIPSTDNPDFYFVNRLEFHPNDSNTMLAACNSGIWRSTDAGDTWTLQAAFHALDVKYNPFNPDQVAAGGHHQHNGAYYSTDGGLTWNQSTGAEGHRQEIAWAPGQPATVYAAVSENSRIKIWRSQDGGQTYTLRTTGSGLQTWSGYNTCIWVDPVNPDLLVVGGVWLYRSTNGGVSFTQRFGAAHADMHRIVQHPDFDGLNNKTVFFATDGGLYETPDVYGNTAIGMNNNLGVTQFYGGGINPVNGNIVGGTQDNGTLFYNGDPQDWDHIFGGDGGYGASDPTEPYYFYGEVQRALIHRSTNGSNSSYIYNGSNPIQDAGSSATTNFIPFFMLDPNEPNTMLVACERMWRSSNVRAGQPDWFPIKDSIEPPERPDGKGDLPGDAHFALNSPYNLSTIAVAQGNSDVIWAGHNNGALFFTTNGTAVSPTWTQVDENGTGLPDRWISTIVIDSRDTDHVYVAFMGWETDNVWETTDGGMTWTDISGSGSAGIPDAPVSALAIHQSIPGRLYAGTDVGVFISNDNGTTWQVHDDMPGNVPVEQLLWKDSSTLLAVTHGRGMFLGTELTTTPDMFEVIEGRHVGGNVSSLHSFDGDVLELAPRRAIVQKVEMILTSTSPVSLPATMNFRLQSSLGGSAEDGNVIQSVKLWNYDTDQFEQIDSRGATIADTAIVVSPAGDLSRFVQPGTGEIMASVSYRRDQFVRRFFTWSIDVDEAVWMIE